MRRTLSFRAVSADGDVDETYDGAVTRVMQVADVLSTHGHQVQVFTGVDDPDAPDEHPERDALLALVDSWRADGDALDREVHTTPEADAITKAQRDQVRACADELLSTLARLSL